MFILFIFLCFLYLLYFVYRTYVAKESFTCKDTSIINKCVQKFKEDTCPSGSGKEACIAKYDICGQYPEGCYQSYGVGSVSDTNLAETQGVANKNLCEPLCQSINDCCFAETSKDNSIFS